MNLQEIKTAIDDGKIVHWKSYAYEVKKFNDQYAIVYLSGDLINLTFQDGKTLNGKEHEFFVLLHPST